MQGTARDMYRSLAVMWAAHSANSVISLVRMKLVAVLVGPAGIGLLGLFQNFQATATTASGLGLSTSGVRELTGSKSDLQAFSKARLALFSGMVLQGAIAAFVIWLLRKEFALLLFDDPALSFEVGILGLSILLALIASSQITLLQGLRRVKDIGKIMTVTALVSTLIGVGAVWWAGEKALVWLLVLQPLTAIPVARHFTRRLQGTAGYAVPLRQLWTAWRGMARVGIPFMIGALVSTGSLLVVRSTITGTAGLDAAGYFAASWSISLLYVNFVLQAINTDFFPRLSEVGADHGKTSQLVNTQILVSLSVGGPVILFTIALAPWLVSVLYSPAFAPTAELLQWQAVGNVLKLVCLPLSYVLVARGHSILFLGAETLWNLMFVCVVFWGLDVFGLRIAGISYLFAYFAFLTFHIVLLPQKFGLALRRETSLTALMLLLLAVVVLLLSQNLGRFGTAAGLFVAMGACVFGLRAAFVSIAQANATVPKRIDQVFALIGWPLPRAGTPPAATK